MNWMVWPNIVATALVLLCAYRSQRKGDISSTIFNCTLLLLLALERMQKG